MGGPWGWSGIVLMCTGAPLLLIVHTVIYWVALGKNRARQIDASDYYLTERTSKALVLYFAAHFLFQVFLPDGGELGLERSIAEKLFGIAPETSEKLILLLAAVTVVLLIAVTTLVCMEPTEFQSIRELVDLDYRSDDDSVQT